MNKPFKTSVFLLLISLLSSSVFAQKSHFDKEKWNEYIEGNIPVVISVPHGGRVTSDTLPVRSCKGAVVGVDGGTIELANAIKDYFQKTHNVTPHIILAHLARKHVDQNRELKNGGVCDNKSMEGAWYRFHNYVDSAIYLATGKAKNKVLYIDLHAHGHKNQRIELGYNLNTADLQKIKDGVFDEKSKLHSLNNLKSWYKGYDFNALMFGKDSFGAYLYDRGTPAVPSPDDMVPLPEEKFFSGGDNTRRFTDGKYPFVFGFQIETHGKARSIVERPNTAKNIAESIIVYLNKYGGYNIVK